jgi:hypothetical protein
MKEDFFCNFKGFWNCNARCHIRLLHEDKRPLIVICSECPDNTGTSICNAFEMIYKEILAKIKKDKLAKELDEFNKIYGMRKNLVQAIISYIIQSFEKNLKNQSSIFNKIPNTKDLIWCEHWPKEPSWEEEYWEVNHCTGQKPRWKKIDLKDLSQRTGYKLLDLDKSNVDLGN